MVRGMPVYPVSISGLGRETGAGASGEKGVTLTDSWVRHSSGPVTQEQRGDGFFELPK